MDDVIGKLLKENNLPDNPTGRAIYKKMLEGVDYDDDDDIQDYKRPWVGLTEDEMAMIGYAANGDEFEAMRLAEAKLRSKNT